MHRCFKLVLCACSCAVRDPQGESRFRVSGLGGRASSFEPCVLVLGGSFSPAQASRRTNPVLQACRHKRTDHERKTGKVSRKRHLGTAGTPSWHWQSSSTLRLRAKESRGTHLSGLCWSRMCSPATDKVTSPSTSCTTCSTFARLAPLTISTVSGTPSPSQFASPSPSPSPSLTSPNSPAPSLSFSPSPSTSSPTLLAFRHHHLFLSDAIFVASHPPAHRRHACQACHLL